MRRIQLELRACKDKLAEMPHDFLTTYYILEKIKLFQKMSVRPSVCPSAKLLYTKIWERIKINACGFFVWKVYTGNRNCQNLDPNARRLTKLEPNEVFNYFARSREAFDEIDSNFFCFKGFRSWSRMKVLLAISWCSNEMTNLIFLSFKYVDKN